LRTNLERLFWRDSLTDAVLAAVLYRVVAAAVVVADTVVVAVVDLIRS